VRPRSSQTLIVAFICLACTGLVWARPYTDSEFLPEYCRHSRDGENVDPVMKEEYFRIFGDGFNHMHHYCRGLFALHEAAQITDNQNRRDGRYQRATIEFNYVLVHSPKSLVLRPEILVKKGLALLAIDRDVDAIKCFQEAVSLRPDYVPAYVALSNYLKRIGEDAEARRVLEAGLTQAPNNGFLQGKLSELGDPKPNESDEAGRPPS